jgi:hypothetical protein
MPKTINDKHEYNSDRIAREELLNLRHANVKQSANYSINTFSKIMLYSSYVNINSQMAKNLE